MRAQKGFTLIELAIVLVIIGLLVGGVLYGNDLIKAAEIRATISQMQNFDAAALTFRVKYNGMPGDIANANSRFGFTDTGQGTSTGNGLIDRATNTDADLMDAESALFFRHLYEAEMISNSISITDGTAANVDSLTATLPPAKLGRGNYIAVMNISGRNQMFLFGTSAIGNGDVTFVDALTPVEAFGFDNKLDDGLATAGIMIAVTDFVTANGDDSGGGASAGECVNGTEYYTAASATKNTAGCLLRTRPSF